MLGLQEALLPLFTIPTWSEDKKEDWDPGALKGKVAFSPDSKDSNIILFGIDL